jgi:uncharacterized membrane protein
VDEHARSEVTGVVHRNVAALLEARRRFEREKPRSVRIADAITAFTGSMRSVALHALVFGGWIVLNLGVVPGIEPFDPFPFVMLAMAASVEAIFLTTFVLVSQNRQAELAESRAELDLQISLLAEHEVTRVLSLVDATARHLSVPRDASTENLEELKRDVPPEKVLEEIERHKEDEERRAA